MAAAVEPEPPTDEGIMTTEEEREAFFVIRAILREKIDPKRVTMRDQRSYCAILLDDNNRKPICRLHFGPGRKAISLFDAQKQEQREPLGDLNELYKFADQLHTTVASYDSEKPA